MKVRKGSKPMRKIIPADPANGVYQEKEHQWIGMVDVVDVDELIAWCKANPDVPADTLATSLEHGVFS